MHCQRATAHLCLGLVLILLDGNHAVEAVGREAHPLLGLILASDLLGLIAVGDTCVCVYRVSFSRSCLGHWFGGVEISRGVLRIGFAAATAA